MPPEQATDGAAEETETDTEGGRDEAPQIELGLYQASVRVRGSPGDDLAAVQSTARELMDHLIDRAEVLEDDPDGRGLG